MVGGMRALGCAGPESKPCQEARLTDAEVVALRFYTTFAYIYMNRPSFAQTSPCSRRRIQISC